MTTIGFMEDFARNLTAKAMCFFNYLNFVCIIYFIVVQNLFVQKYICTYIHRYIHILLQIYEQNEDL